MEQWEAIIEACPELPDLRYFNKAIQAAGFVLKKDLAHFEIEWILHTLLHKPVSLLTTVRSQRNDNAWSKAIGDGLKLLADICSDHRQAMESHFEDVVSICLPLSSFDPQTRKQAIQCLTSVARVSAAAARDFHKHVFSFQDMTTCKAPMALFIGSICEHHPEIVSDDINRIWRIYLNLLDTNKNTDTITSSLLQGILGLFKHFGCDLPTAELNDFYDQLSEHYITMSKSRDVCLYILASHSPLFRERLSRDARLRRHLWSLLDNSSTTRLAVQAVTSVYKAMCGPLAKEALQRIATNEISPQTSSYNTDVKYTALRILTHMQTHCGVQVAGDRQTDVHSLQFELRSKVPKHIAEGIAWCIESTLPNSEILLQTAMLFYENLPLDRRKSIVVHGLLNASPELRSTAVTFLISESINSPLPEDHLPLWRDMFDSNGGKDITVLDKSRLVFEDFMSYVIFVVESFLESGETLPEKLVSLLNLTTHILTLVPQEEYSKEHCAVLLPLLVQLMQNFTDSSIVAAGRCAASHVDPGDNEHVLKEMYATIHIDSCKDEALLCESCLALIAAPDTAAPVGSVLTALQIIFARNDVEPATLSNALHKLENLIAAEDKTDQNCIHTIIQQIEKLRTRKDLTTKDARVLHRDVLMFLGKYGNDMDVNNNTTESIVLVKLLDSFNLNIPNVEGTNYKVNLQRIVQLALEYEEPSALQTLLVIMCANLDSRKEANLQLTLTRVCRSLSRALAAGAGVDARALQAAVSLCDSWACVQGLLQYISEEKSPGVRRMLSDALEGLLKEDRDDRMLSSVAEHAGVLMRSTRSTRKRAGLNITETLLIALHENNSLTKKLLPELMLLIATTFEVDSEVTFEVASRNFIEKIELFEKENIEQLLHKLIVILLQYKGIQHENSQSKMADEFFLINQNVRQESNMADIEARIYKNTSKMILEFVRRVHEYRKQDKNNLFEIIFAVLERDYYECDKILYVLADAKKIFDPNMDLCRHVVWNKKCMVLNKPFCRKSFVGSSYFCIEAALRFLEEYSAALFEIQCEETLELLADAISNISPKIMKHVYKNIKSCLSVYTKNKAPRILQNSFEGWCSKLPLEGITNSIEEGVTAEHTLIIFSLKIMLQYFDVATLTDVKMSAQKWAKILLKLFSSGYITDYLKTKMSYLTDLLTVSVKFLTVTDVKKIISEGSNLEGLPTEKIGVQFCRSFMHVFFEVLVRKPHFLLDEDMGKCSVLLNDVVKFTLKKKLNEEQLENLLELVDQLWPAYSAHSTFSQKHSLLVDLSHLPSKLSPRSNPMLWAVEVLSSDSSSEDKARIVGVLPGGEAYSGTYRSFASLLPTRLSELAGAGAGAGGARSSFRALLDALAASRDAALMDIVVALAGGDDKSGWWDEALESCMASVAAHPGVELYRAVYGRVWDGLSLGVCRRVLLPLLRYSTSSFCESYYSTILEDLLRKLSRPAAGAPTPYIYHKKIVDFTRVFSILQIAFEKIPASSLESPSSTLYREVAAQHSWHIIRQTCKLCYSRRQDVEMPAGADEKLTEDYRQFQCANYNCFSAAICRMKPEEKYYDHIFNVDAWNKLTDRQKDYNIKIRNQWNQRTTRQPSSIALDSSAAPSSSSLTRTAGTSRTRLFLRTLSESPLMYDLIEHVAEEVQFQDLHLSPSELNTHECAATLTALLSHVAALPYSKWKKALEDGLRNAQKNTKWLLAQAICNAKEELKPHADAISSALLELISSTAVEANGKQVMNGLHVDIIETLVHWKAPIESPSSLVRPTELLLATCLERRQQTSLYNSLLNTLGNFLDVYGNTLQVKMDVFEPYLADPDTPKTLQILQRLSKYKVYIPALLPKLLDRLESKQYYQLSKLAELLGLALSACGDKSQYLIRFRKVLDATRKTNAGDYVKMLYYAQSGCPESCDEYNFRMTQKILVQEREKCLQILNNYAAHHPHSSYVQDMYETIDFSELIMAGSVEAIHIVRDGVKMMKDGMKRRLVMQVAGYCQHSAVKVRRAACEVMLKAFDDLTTIPETPPAKKSKMATTFITRNVLSEDVYSLTIMNAIAGGCLDSDGDVSGAVREGVAKAMSRDVGLRFTEAFLLTVYLPSTCVNSPMKNLSLCVYSLLDLLFRDLRAQERFRKITLRDEPLVIRNPDTGPSKLLTMSTTYQGTFRSHSALTGRRRKTTIDENASKPEIDVQIPIDDILNTLLQFANNTPQAASAFCLEFVRSIKASQGWDQGLDIARCLSVILGKEANELTPFIVGLCGVFIEDLCTVSGIKETVKKLLDKTKNTEGAHITKTLYQEITLRCSGNDQFLLGVDGDDELFFAMDEDGEFCIEDLTSAFGKLSNWDSLTIQQRNQIKNSGLPPLWTDAENLQKQIESSRTSIGWLNKMMSAYRGEEKESVMKWLRAMDRWPARNFDISAITEAVEWLTKNGDVKYRACNIQPADCLAEWAARLMIRTAYHTQHGDDQPSESQILLSRSHELIWCERANERALGSAVLECVKRNTGDLYKSETLRWLRQKVWALRHIGLEKDDQEMLKRALSDAETYCPQFAVNSTPDVVVGMNKLILLLNRDLNCLNEDKLQDLFNTIDGCTKEPDDIYKNRQSLKEIYESALSYYDDVDLEERDSDPHNANKSLSNMADVLHRCANCNITDSGIVALVLNKLDDFEGNLIEENVAKIILEAMNLIVYKIDDFCLQQLKSKSKLFPSRLLVDYPFMRERDHDATAKYKKCFQLICDAEYSLLQYCDLLLRALSEDDADNWKTIFERIKNKIFENPYAGSDYQLLNKYKMNLYEIAEYEPSSDFKSSAERTLKGMLLQLRRRDPQSVLRLSQLCPALSRCEDCPGKLLGLPVGVHVVRIDEQVQMFTDSVRRPTILTVLLSTGATRRYLHKSGEPLSVDMAAQNVVKYAGRVWEEMGGTVVGYNVTPLSADCGLIEFLEDHKRLRELVGESCDLNAVSAVQRPKDEDLLCTPPAACLVVHERVCDVIPRHALRGSVARRCLTVQDWRIKTSNFQSAVASSTILTWILGLGDRHLENILYSIQDGRLCHVDWAALFQYGVGELPPARLTRNIQALCDTQELEAEMQQLLASLRNSHKLFTAVLKISFKHMESEFKDKLPYAEAIVKGSALSYHTTRAAVDTSPLKLETRTKLVDLLDGVFQEVYHQETYSVEQQITSLLRQCTDPQILSITRSGWEPWV